MQHLPETSASVQLTNDPHPQDYMRRRLEEVGYIVGQEAVSVTHESAGDGDAATGESRARDSASEAKAVASSRGSAAVDVSQRLSRLALLRYQQACPG